jgi:hypothetical protein
VFVRELPGGGFAAIDVHPRKALWNHRRFRGTLVVERRPASRRAGHTPPTIAEASGASVEAVVRQLLPAAQFNSALGLGLLQWQHQRA